MKATIEISVTVTADDGAVQARQVAVELRPPRVTDVTIFGGFLLGMLMEAMQHGLPMDAAAVQGAIAQMKQQCEAGIPLVNLPPPGKR